MSIAATMAANENVLASPRRAIFAPDIGQHHVARPPLRHSNAKRALDVADMHGQSRLGHDASLGGTAEMGMFGERGTITKLSKG
jgi:hypothetical protein